LPSPKLILDATGGLAGEERSGSPVISQTEHLHAIDQFGNVAKTNIFMSNESPRRHSSEGLTGGASTLTRGPPRPGNELTDGSD